MFINEYKKKHKLSDEQWKVVNAILKCKTKELGYHTITCKECGEKFCYHIRSNWDDYAELGVFDEYLVN